jgi:hypothetical protein
MELQNEGGAKPGRKPGQRRRTPLEIARDRAEITNLRLLKRKSVSEISAIISARYLDEIVDEETGLNAEGKRPPHVGLKQVRNELEGAIEDYKDSMVDEIHAKRLEAIRRYDRIAGLAFEEYEKSALDGVTKTAETQNHPEHGEITKEKEVTVFKTVGDPRFLNLYTVCLDKVAELESIIPPRKTALTNPDGTEPFKFEGMEELKRLEALANELLNPSSGDKLKEIT